MKQFYKFKCRIGNDDYDLDCYLDLNNITSFEIEENTILLWMHGHYRRIYATKEDFFTLLAKENINIKVEGS